jgi:hypothetical protein
MAPKRKLGEILVESGMIDGFQLRSALADQKRWGRPLGVTLVKLGFVDEEELLRMLSRQLDVAIVDLHGKRIAPEALAMLPVEVAEKHRCVPLFKKREAGADVLYLGMEDPTDLAVLDDLAFRTGLKVKPVLVGPTQLTETIERHYHKVEWDEDDEGPPTATFETPIEAGDTAPLVFRPGTQSAEREEPRVVGPELREGEVQPLAGAEPEPLVPPSADPSDSAFDFAKPLESDAPAAPPAETQPAPAPAPRTHDEPLEFNFERPGPTPPSESSRPTLSSETAPASPGAKPRDVSTRVILRAVTHLLIEKGIITREELMEQVRASESEG